MPIKAKRPAVLRALCLEDSPQDAEIMRELLIEAGFDLKMDCTAAEKHFVSFLRTRPYDIVLSDFKLPDFDAFGALRWTMEICPKVPFICVSGAIGEETAIELLKQGAIDYVLKDRLARLPSAIERALGEAQEKEAWRRAEKALRTSEEKFKKAFYTSPDSIIITRLVDGKIISVNKGFSDLTGYPEEKVIGKTTLEINFWDDPEDRKKVVEGLKTEGMVKNFEARFHAKNGKIVFGLMSASIIDLNGTPHILNMTRNIADRKRAEEKLRETHVGLQKAFEGIIQVLSVAVEMRDPCTSGHERRVADLARDIAKEMGFEGARLIALSMAGAIHDVGKLSIPAEILCKPGRLSAFELKFIQAHSQMGHDILKEIDFPWPIADMILQHHERMNGSGYPRGLKDQEILLEARILAVADVVEAMASHRPYRPALGIDAALEEIEKNKGILFDPEVVEACLKLFKEKGFKFKKEPSDSTEQRKALTLLVGGQG